MISNEEKEMYLILAGWSLLVRDGQNWWFKFEVDKFWNLPSVAYEMELKRHVL